MLVEWYGNSDMYSQNFTYSNIGQGAVSILGVFRVVRDAPRRFSGDAGALACRVGPSPRRLGLCANESLKRDLVKVGFPRER